MKFFRFHSYKNKYLKLPIILRFFFLPHVYERMRILFVITILYVK